MIETKKAVYAILTGDSTLMNKLSAPPYGGRLPETAQISSKPALTIRGTAAPQVGPREEQFVEISVWGMSGDAIESVADDLRRLLHPTHSDTQWQALNVSDGMARIRLDSEDDLPDLTSQVQHKLMRFRVLYARQYEEA